MQTSTVRVTLRSSAGHQVAEVEAFASDRGLAVTPTATAYDKKCGRYRVTHLASGEGIGFFKNRPAAVEAFRRLLALDIDWTRPKVEVVTAENAAKIHAAGVTP